ncbi:MAG: hypothetical protein AAGD06_27705 [Acidobacteriota bacterium]
MKKSFLIVLAASMLGGLVAPQLLAEDTKPFTITGVNYTKWLWGNSRFDGSLYNFTTIPGEGFGDSGQGTELELLVSAKPSKKIEVQGRMKARFNQNFWTNGGGFGNPGGLDPIPIGTGNCLAGDCGEFDSRSAQYIKFRGLTIIITPGYRWVDTITVGSSDFGMFDPFTVGKIRFIDRDNNAGLIFQGSSKNRKFAYDFARISLNRLVYGPDFTTGDYNVDDATWVLQTRFTPSSKFDLALIASHVQDYEIDATDFDLDDGRDLTTRFSNTVVGARFGIHPSSKFDIRGAIYASEADSDEDLTPSSFGLAGFSPVPAGELDDIAWQLNLDINDPFDNGLSFQVQLFDIGADYVSITAARREEDVLLTEGHDATFAWPGPSNVSFGVFNTGNLRIGYGGWQGHAQQVATINVDNEFTDFDEPLAETAIGWKGFTIAPNWNLGDLNLEAEYTQIDYSTNWQAWGDESRAITDSIYPNHESDAGIGSFRNAYAPFQEKETDIYLIKGDYFLDVGNGLELFGKIKFIDETDKRLDDPRFLPYQPGDCPGGGVECAGNTNLYNGTNSTADLYGNPPVITVDGVTGYQWKPFDDIADDDRDMDYSMFQFGAGYQLTDEVWGSVTYEYYDIDLQDGNTAFQAYQLHEMASGDHQKNKLILLAKYNIGGAEIGFNYEYNWGDFDPDFGDGFVTQFADAGIQENLGFAEGTPGFRGRFGGWNSLASRDFEQQRFKAFLKLLF